MSRLSPAHRACGYLDASSFDQHDSGTGLARDGFGRRFACQALVQLIQCLALLINVLVTVVVARLHACQAVRLEVASNFATDAIGGEQRLDTGPN